MKQRIYLDDIRTPVDKDWIISRDYNQFVAAIQFYGLENIETISLDHDLGDTAMIEYYSNVQPNYSLDYNNITEKTGLDCCKFLVAESMNTKIPLPQIYVHSANPIGTGNMIGYINNYYKNRKQEFKCVQVNIDHTIDESLQLSVEERHARWKR
jgi:hypothetical protein